MLETNGEYMGQLRSPFLKPVIPSTSGYDANADAEKKLALERAEAAENEFFELFPVAKDASLVDWNSSESKEHFSIKSEYDDSNFARRLEERPLPLKNNISAARTRRWRKWDLPMVFGDLEIPACPDSGSEENIILQDVVTKLGLLASIDPATTEAFTLGNGKRVESIGMVRILCTFAKDRYADMWCCFNVFKELVVPLIMGAGFLRQTETLTRYRSRLRERPNQEHVIPRSLQVDNAKERLMCFLNHEPVMANADTGSEMNLISSAYACKVAPDAVQQLESQREVQFADGSTACLAGVTAVKFSLTTNSHAFEMWFYVLDGLTCDVLLGEETLDEVDAFDPDRMLVIPANDTKNDISRIDLNTIVWLEVPERLLARAASFFSSSIYKRKRRTSGQ